MDRIRELNVKQLTSLLSWYRIRGRSRMTTREAKIQALNNIPEVINNAQQIADNRREIFREIDNMPRRRANQPQLPLPIPQIRPRNRPNLPPLNIPQPTQIPGTPPGSPDRYRPGTPPDTPPPTRPPPPIPTKPKKQVIKNESVKNTEQTPFLGNVLNKFWDFVKPYIPEKVKNKAEELAKNFIDRYKKANEINQPKNQPNRTKSKRDYKKEGARPKTKRLKEEELIIKENVRKFKNGYLNQHTIDGKKGYTIVEFMKKIKPKVIGIINKDKKPKKVKVILASKFVKSANNQIVEQVEKYFQAKPKIITEASDLSKEYDDIIKNILGEVERFHENTDSGVFEFDSVVRFDLGIAPYTVTSGSSYIPTPERLATKKATINIQNKCEDCGQLSLTEAVFPRKHHRERVNNELLENCKKLNFSGIEGAMKLKDFDKFEKQNPYPVNVLKYDEEADKIYTARLSDKCYCKKEEKCKNCGCMKKECKKKQKCKKKDCSKHECEECGCRKCDCNNYECKLCDCEFITLLLINNGEKNHYILVNNVSRLLSSEIDNNKHKKHFCLRCFNSFYDERILQEHKEYCDSHGEVKIKMPKNEDGSPKFIYFKNFKNKMRSPFVVYADFEGRLIPIHTCSPNEIKSFTKNYQMHKTSGFCYYIKCFDESILPKDFKICVNYTAKSDDEDVAQIFTEYLERDVRKIFELIEEKKETFKVYDKKNMTEMDKKDYENATNCHICEREFSETEEEDFKKVIDHCHLTGKYRGAAHNICNLKYVIPKFVPVVIHNLSGYDSHLFIKNLGKTKGEMSCLANTDEKYISFSKKILINYDCDEDEDENEKPITRTIRFIDSYKFMQCSLSGLVDNLTKCGKCESCKPGKCLKRYIKDGKIITFNGVGNCDQCKNCKLLGSMCFSPIDKNMAETKKHFAGEKLKLLLRKGVFPYDYFDRIDKLNETEIPPKEAFKSILNNQDISDEDYEHAKNVWKTFDAKTMRDYHDLYLKTDVLQLADVFENFRDVCINNYSLDPAHYFTSPGLSWDAMLKLTKVSLELFTDVNMLLFIEKGIRGGTSQVTKRYAKANNPYMTDFEINKLISYIIYLDANNLYGAAMSKKLPKRGFKWIPNEELENWRNMPCILEVDLEYPKNLHDSHKDLPLAPEKLAVNKVKKLIPNLFDKKRYVIHHETLKFYEKQGLKITKIHKGIKFQESKWLQTYIDRNTELRKHAKNDFEKDFFKLMNNSVFGKTMENMRKRIDVRLVNNIESAKKLIRKPNFNHFNIFSEDLAAINMKKTEIRFNKPVYVGFSILDLSKQIMYDFHYNYIKEKYGEKAELLMTDTDSLVYNIETEDFYEDISQDVREKFDTSNYPKNHKSGIWDETNKKVIGKFKDEFGGSIPIEFVGLGAKQYALLMDNGKEIKKNKGTKKLVVKKTISFNDFKNCLRTKEPQMRSQNLIGSKLHDIYTKTVNKKALSAYDDKRIIQKDGIHTFPYGHYRAEPAKTELGGNTVS